MKSLRYLSTMSALALCAVLVSAQDSGLGRGRGGGGGGTGGGSGPSRPPSNPPSPPSKSSPPPSSPSRSGPDRSGPDRSGPSRDQDKRPSDNQRGGGQSGPSRDRDSGRGSEPQRGGGSSQSGPSRDRDSGRGNDTTQRGGGSQSGPSRDRDSSGQPQRGGSTTNPGLNRPSRDNDSGLGRGRAPQEKGRTGEVRYQGNNNVSQPGRAPVFSTRNAPNGIIRIDSLNTQAYREDGLRGRNSLVVNGWRNGYFHYNNGWNDNRFWYPNYCFSPFTAGVNVVISPWYYYSFLPGYLNCNRVVVTSWNSPWGWNSGVVYVNNSYDNGWGWGGNNNNGRQDSDVEDARADLLDTFERYDQRSLSRLVPRNGQIAILRDGRYDYSIGSADFYDLLNDLSSNAETRRYRILEIRTRRESARISAVHEFVDAWGNRQQVYHMIYLERERDGMVIREFGTSDRRVW